MNLMIPKKLLVIFNNNELNDVLTKYFYYLKSKSLSENTIKNYFRDLIGYFNYLNQNNLSAFKSIKPEHIRKMLSFLIDRGFSIEGIAVISGVYISLSLVLLFLVKNKLNPVKL